MEISTQFTVEQWHLVALCSFLYFLMGVVTGRMVYRREPFPTDGENSSVGVIAGILWPLMFLWVVLLVVGWILVSLVTFKNGRKE